MILPSNYRDMDETSLVKWLVGELDYSVQDAENIVFYLTHPEELPDDFSIE